MMPSTLKNEFLYDLWTEIQIALDRIEKRFQRIRFAEDFAESELGLTTLDSIILQLAGIRENVKRIEKETGDMLKKRYPDVDWKGIIGLRDYISHHYFQIDAEIIFDICENNLESLRQGHSRAASKT